MQSPREHFIEREIGHVHFGPGRLFRRLLASLTEESFRLWKTAQSSVAAPASPKTQHLKGIPIWPWDISAVSFRRPRLTLPFCGLDANGSNLEVSCVQEALHVASEPELILERLMSPKTKFVSITLTRAGFYLDRDDTFLVEHPDIQHDLHAVRGRQFKTMYGFLRAAALYRLEHRLPPLVVVSFDNIFHNGASLRRCLFEFCRLVDPDSANLVVEALAEDVYRVPSLKALCPKPLIIRSGLADHICPAQALFSESYRRVFIGMREHDCQLPSLLPPWTLLPDTVIFSSDLATLQTAQTRMGNGVNVCIAWLGAVIGARYIHEVLEHRQAAMLLQDIMMLEIVPTLPVPTQSELSLSNLAMATLARFTAKASRDPLLRLNNPTVTKVWQRIGPTLRHARRLGLPCPRLSFICQVWAQYEESFSLAEKRVVLQKLAIPWRSEAELQPMLAALQGRALPRSVSDPSSSSSSSSLQPSQVCVLFNYEDTLAITEPHAHSLFAPSSQREEEDQCVLSQLPSMIQPTPGSTTVLEYFLHRRVPWGIVSNHSTPRVEACVYALQQQRYITARRIFSARSSLSECQPKPQPDIYQFAKEAMTDEICDGRRHRAPHIVFLAVEDSPAGVFAAKEAGVDLVIGFMGALELEAAKMKGQFDSSRLVKQREELQKAGAHLVLSNLEDLVWVYQNVAASLTCFGLNFR